MSGRTPKILSKQTKTVSVTDNYELSQPILLTEHYDLKKSYDWKHHVDNVKCLPVQEYANAPLQSVFHHLRPGLKVEVPNKDYWTKAQTIGGIYWVAHVIKVVGYKALVRYEGYEEHNASADFWINLCSMDLHPVGWCAGASKPLVPPSAISGNQSDWKSYLVRRLTGARTLPHDFQDKVRKALTDCPFKVGMRLEMIDRNKPERLKVGVVQKVIANRLFITPSSSDTPDTQTSDEATPEDVPVDFWCNSGSGLIFPVAFACRTGYPILCTEAYKKHCKKIVTSDANADGSGSAYGPDDAKPNIFNLIPKAVLNMKGGKDGEENVVATPDPGSMFEANIAAAKSLLKWELGMKLECLDPVEMNAFYVVTVSEILDGGYLRLTIDGTEDQQYLFNQNSPYLFPAGFCDANSIEKEEIKGATGTFGWNDYLTQTQSVAAPPALFDYDKHEHKFEVGCKLEAVDSLEPKLVCVATVVDIKGSRLLKLRYDGWEESYDQWQDYRSPDIYPIGWSETVGYTLEAPKNVGILEMAAVKRKLASSSVANTPPPVKKSKDS